MINIKPNTIFMLVGPSGCGKTTFINSFFVKLNNQYSKKMGNEAKIKIISTEIIRNSLTGGDNNLNDCVAEEVYKRVFDDLKTFTTFPINYDFIIIDWSGISVDLREKVFRISEENMYNTDIILFDYKIDLYLENSLNKKRTMNQSQSLKKYFYKTTNKRNFPTLNNLIKVKDLNFDGIKFELNKSFDLYKNTLLDTNYEYVIIGDIHEKTEELKSLIIKNGFEIDDNEIIIPKNNKKIILNGDIVDKSYNTPSIIEFIHKNIENFIFINGNHEEFVYLYLKGRITKSPSNMDVYFSSIKFFQEDESLKNKFFDIYKKSLPFAIFSGENRKYYISHAICEEKYLGKMDSLSIKKNRNIRKLEENWQNIIKNSKKKDPVHIFGHFPFKKIIDFNNKIGIDTGCFLGNRLSAVTISNNKKHFFTSVNSETEIKTLSDEELITLDFIETRKQKMVSYKSLEDKDKMKVDKFIEDGIEFISGTISPADKDINNNELESLKKGLEYYAKKRINRVILQPKYMGSRLNLYIKSDGTAFGVSRNGYIVRSIDDFIMKEKNKWLDFMKERKIKSIILDGELMPWRALGGGLIDYTFENIDKSIKSELDILKSTGFSERIEELKNSERFEEFLRLKNQLNKKEMSKHFNSVEMESFNQLHAIKNNIIDLNKLEEYHKTYHEQVKIFGKEEDIHYNPFNILKIEYENGKIDIPSNNIDNFKLVNNNSEFIVIDFKYENWLNKAKDFYSKITEIQSMEGIVIKPEETVENIAPYLKVRNKKYLTLIYGYDYLSENKYKKLIDKKNINKKIRKSIEEYDISKKILEYKDKENEEYKDLISTMILKVEDNKDIDPRL